MIEPELAAGPFSPPRETPEVDLALWRGACPINELRIVKVTGKVPVPLLDAPVVDLSVSWSALWHHHAVVARVLFLRPELNFVDGGNRQSSPIGAGTDWRAVLEKLLRGADVSMASPSPASRGNDGCR